ncbi:hypothetical protein LINPERHAP2_LOCUS24204 [Linum perenne]
MAPETKPILSKLKPGSSSNQDGSNRKRIEISSKQPIKSVKIESSSSKQPIKSVKIESSSSKQPIKSVKIESSSNKQPIKSVSTVTRTEVKSTTTSTSKATTTTTKTTRVKKVFSLAGQRYDPPEEVPSFDFMILYLCAGESLLGFSTSHCLNRYQLAKWQNFG